MSSTGLPEEYRIWVREVLRAIDDLGGSSAGLFIDAVIPFRLGWTPSRAARAICNLNGRDADTLAQLMLGDYWQEKNASHSGE